MKYRYTKGAVEDLTAEAITGFIDDYRNGKLELIYKSDKIPAQTYGPFEVREVVGKTWK